MTGLNAHLRGHLLQFDAPAEPDYSPHIGARLLASAMVLEIARLAVISTLGSAVPLWLFMPLLLALAVAAVPLTGMTFTQIGFRRWREWSPTEHSYFLQVIVIANLVFPFVLGPALRNRFGAIGTAATIGGVFLPYLAYGFYQEIVYRGMVQSQLVRRHGPAAGILGANVLYTFGPLHHYYWTTYQSQALPMFAAVFAIGLLFGVLYRRSGNLWIVAVMHAIGNAYMATSLSTAG
jgi:membrane protease YdiL (CAAX protease family)